MASTMNPDDLRARYVTTMGQSLGEVFHHLMQEMARLHLKWNELLTLFGQEKGRVDMLNRAAPGFFHLVQDSWWDDVLLGISRITDDRTDVLTVRRLPKLVPVAIRADVASRTATVVATTGFARDHRNRMIAHRSIDLVLGRPCTPLIRPTAPLARSRRTLRRVTRRSVTLLTCRPKAKGKTETAGRLGFE